SPASPSASATSMPARTIASTLSPRAGSPPPSRHSHSTGSTLATGLGYSPVYGINNLYVSPTGDDDAPGTLAEPFATTPRALQAAGKGGETVIHLRAGSYPPFELTGEDRDLTLQPHEHEEAVISGGRTITGWTREDDVWTAGAGDLDTRRLARKSVV